MIVSYLFSSKTHLVWQRERKLYVATALAKVVCQQERVSCSQFCSHQRCTSYFTWKWEVLCSTLTAEAQLWIQVPWRRILACLSATQLPDASLKRLINMRMLIHVSSQSYPPRLKKHSLQVAVPPLPGCHSGQSPMPATPQRV